ncbi:MAG: hypothetical protein COT18_04420 [Elusimicrobia bacterium CG08_land_8_20_14_0_20_59_10]|nr:MAG: hypothetical protein COT18_04420 [Elusimicrobia bacterium CG08_land_8_20_14_0_20_59_10]
MVKKEHVLVLFTKAIKTLVILFTLFSIGWFVARLPFAQELSFLSRKLPVGVFLDSVVSLLAVLVFVAFGAEIAPAADALLEFIPKAGALAGNLVKVLAVLFSYGAFQRAVLPFIPDFEWAYQSVFLGLILFFLARSGLLLYAASENISGFLMGLLNPYRQPAGTSAAIKEEQPKN